MRVWEATPEDLPDLVEYGRRFHEASGTYGESLSFDDVHYWNQLVQFLSNDRALVLTADGGSLGAILFQPCFSTEWVAQELWWWVDQDQRRQGIGKELFRSFEEWAEEQGASVIIVSTLGESMDRAMRYYTVEGYKHAEHCYLRRL